jgi:hypothetical protein
VGVVGWRVLVVNVELRTVLRRKGEDDCNWSSHIDRYWRIERVTTGVVPDIFIFSSLLSRDLWIFFLIGAVEIKKKSTV